jgi:hypothetical protein
LRDVVGPRERSDEVETVLGDVGVGDDYRDLGLVCLAHGGDHGLAVGRPDDHRVDVLLDEVLYLRDLAGHVAAGVQNDDFHVGFFGGGDERLLIGRLVAVDAHIVLRDADRHRLRRSGTAQRDQRGRAGQRKLSLIGHFFPPMDIWRLQLPPSPGIARCNLPLSSLISSPFWLLILSILDVTVSIMDVLGHAAVCPI